MPGDGCSGSGESGSQNGSQQGDQAGQQSGGEGRQTATDNMTGGGSTDADSGSFEGDYVGGGDQGDGSVTGRDYQETRDGSGVTPPKGRNVRARGEIREPGDAPQVDVSGVGPVTAAETPYYSVRPPSEAEVEDALDRDNVPASQRDYVHGYFDGLERAQ